VKFHIFVPIISTLAGLFRRGPTSVRVKLRRTQCEQMSSGLPLKADIAQYSRHVSNVPIGDVKPLLLS